MEFDSLIDDWLLKNYGSHFGEQLWHDKMINLLTLNLREDDGECEHEMCMAMVQDALTEVSPKVAEITIKSKQFDTVKWHLQWRARQHEKPYLELKKTTGGEAQRMVHEAGHRGMQGTRSYLMLRFAQIQSPQLKHRQKQHTLGVPSSPGAPMLAEDCKVFLDVEHPG
jgi:hypothetical protein